MPVCGSACGHDTSQSITSCPLTSISSRVLVHSPPASTSILHPQLLLGAQSVSASQITLFPPRINCKSEALPCSATSSSQPLLLASIPAGPSPGSWGWCPSRCAPQGGTWRCGARWWAGAGGRAWTGPAVLTARAGCPAPTPRGPPRLPSVHGPVAGSKWQPTPQYMPEHVAPEPPGQCYVPRQPQGTD